MCRISSSVIWEIFLARISKASAVHSHHVSSIRLPNTTCSQDSHLLQRQHCFATFISDHLVFINLRDWKCQLSYSTHIAQQVIQGLSLSLTLRIYRDSTLSASFISLERANCFLVFFFKFLIANFSAILFFFSRISCLDFSFIGSYTIGIKGGLVIHSFNITSTGFRVESLRSFEIHTASLFFCYWLDIFYYVILGDSSNRFWKIIKISWQSNNQHQG